METQTRKRTRKRKLTAKQLHALRLMREFQREHGRVPTVRELGDLMGLTVATAFGYCRRLVTAGFLSRTGKRMMPFTLTEQGTPNAAVLATRVPILRSTTGDLSLAPENIAGYWTMPISFLAAGETAVMVPAADGRLLTVLLGPAQPHQLVAIAHRGRVETGVFPFVPDQATVLGIVIAAVERINERWSAGESQIRGGEVCLAA